MPGGQKVPYRHLLRRVIPQGVSKECPRNAQTKEPEPASVVHTTKRGNRMAKAKFGNAGFSFRGYRVRTANLPEEFWAMAIATDERTLSGDGIARSPALDGLNGAWNGVSWSAVIAGAFTAIAVSIIVIALGTGIGMEVVSPYSSSSPSAGTMTAIGALWLVFAQAVGFAVGGYVAGRLRRPPANMHTAEVKFRDGANGLVVWAIGVVLSFFILASAIDKVGSAAGTAVAGTAGVGLGSA